MIESYTKHRFNPKVLYPKTGGKKSCSCLISHTDPIYLFRKINAMRKNIFIVDTSIQDKKFNI